MARADKVLVLGIDGMDPRYSKKLLSEGKMPNLQKFVEKGAQREDLAMMGGHPTITPPMWASLSTGAYPMTHGITCFNRQNGTHLDEIGYNMNSALCRAEHLWNVTAEAGKKTLVWHWPGGSWPPTSDNPNLYVVDGTQTGAVNGMATVDSEFILLAKDTIEVASYQPMSANDTNIPCVVKDLTPKMTLDRNQGTRKKVLLTPEEGESIVSIMPFDVVISPLKDAHGWVNAPADAKEFTILFSGGTIRRVGLLFINEEGIYDHVALYKNKKAEQPYVELPLNVFVQDVLDEAIKNEEKYTASRNMRLLEVEPDGSSLKLWVSPAMDINNDYVFHPKRIFKDIRDNVGYPQPFSFLGGSDKVLINDCTGANWTANAKWQAGAIKYLIEHEGIEIIFSHFHNIDLQGHMIVKYLKDKGLPGAKLSEEEYQELFENVYLQTDDYIGEFLPLLDEGWTIFILSDHGQVCPEHEHYLLGDPTGVNVPVMRALGFTVMEKDENGKDTHDINWSKTRAVAVRANHIYINLKGRQDYGIVDPEDQYELEEEIMTALYGYRDPETGKRIIAMALRNKDAAVLGLSGPECGDIIYFTAEGYTMDHGDCLTTTYGYANTSVAPIFVAAGKGLKESYTTDRVIRLVDIAPTVAVLAGVRMPKQCEGAPIYQILAE